MMLFSRCNAYFPILVVDITGAGLASKVKPISISLSFLNSGIGNWYIGAVAFSD